MELHVPVEQVSALQKTCIMRFVKCLHIPTLLAGRWEEDRISCMESLPIKVGCCNPGRCGPDLYATWLQGPLLGSCIRNYSITCIWCCWTCEL